MKILFAHPNFPGQFKHLVRHFAKKSKYEVVFITTHYNKQAPEGPLSIVYPDEIMENFDSIAYEKGASVVRMMANFMGVDNFNTGITSYLDTYQYDNAAQDDLWAVLDNFATLEPGVTIKDIMDTWVRQK